MDSLAKHSCSLGTKLGLTVCAHACVCMCACACVRVRVCVCGGGGEETVWKDYHLKERTMAMCLLEFATSPRGPEIFPAPKIKPDGER